MFLTTILLSLGLAACQTPGSGTAGGVVVAGQMKEAAGMQVYLDRLNGPNQASLVIDKTDVDAQGAFELTEVESVEPGIYRLRFGARKLPLIFGGDEERIEINGSLAGLQKYEYDVVGSASSASFQGLLEKLASRAYQSADVANYIDTVSNAYAGVYAAELALGPKGEHLDAHKRARTRLEEQNTSSAYLAAYAEYIDIVEAQYAAQQAQELIKVGAQAPDIELPSPTGDTYRLSDLKGSVVLLDFWASWCGPCRVENPNVVKVYNKYKDRGFTVFSVSLDGLDSRMRQAMQSQEQIEKQTEASKDRWIRAIEQDQLKWPYHVSDLKKWGSIAAKTYGVGAIPRTFLIDREGTIVALNTRGRLEEELTKYLYL